MKHFSFPSITQFRNVVKNIRDNAGYHGIPLPVVTFQGTVKLHGTNAGVVMDLSTQEMWAQSRENCITPESDNAGFARFVADNDITFRSYFKTAQDLSVSGDDISKPTHLAIFGEWCGKGIMKGVALNQLEKRFVVFGCRVITDMPDNQAILRWLPGFDLVKIVASDDNPRMFCIQNFKTWTIDVDFAQPEIAQNELVRITDEVENECPFGKAFDVSGIGEGVVWKVLADAPNQPTHPGFQLGEVIFKVKGKKHSDSHVTSTAEVDVEKVANARAYADAVVTDHRLEKMFEKLKEQGIAVDIRNTGAFLKLVGQDVIKEETDRLEASDLEWKDVSNVVNTAAKQWWMIEINKF